MTARILPPAEWRRLPLAACIPLTLNPETSRVLVVESAGAIVGTLVLLRTVHAEFLWIAPEARKRAGVGRALLRLLHPTVRAWGVTVCLGAAISREMRRLLPKLGGVKLPGASYVIPMKGVQ